MPKSSEDAAERVDKWMWCVRMVKTRTLGTELCRGSHVTVNGDKVKASHTVRIGDVVEAQLGSSTKRYKVLGLLARRVSAKEAASYFENLSPPPMDPIDRIRGAAPAPREKGSGRPTKKDRRDIGKLTGKYL